MKINEIKKVVLKYDNKLTRNYDILCFKKSETGFVLTSKSSFKDFYLMETEFNLLVESGFIDLANEYDKIVEGYNHEIKKQRNN